MFWVGQFRQARFHLACKLLANNRDKGFKIITKAKQNKQTFKPNGDVVCCPTFVFFDHFYDNFLCFVALEISGCE
jgi:hypothetical protein